jgi:integrase
MPSKRGTGSLFLRGKVWWIKYYRAGRPFRETSKSTKRADAVALLQKRLGQVSQGQLINPRADRVAFDELTNDYIASYEVNALRSLPAARVYVAHLLRTFGGRPAQQLTTADVRNYVLRCQQEGLANATINRRLAALSKCFTLGIRAEKIYRRPTIEMLRENNVRKGFFEREAFDAVRTKLDEEVVRDIAMLAFWTGWRKNEICSLECKQVDVGNRSIRMDPGVSKGGEGRLVFLPSEPWAVVEKWWNRRRFRQRSNPRGNPQAPWQVSRYLFHRYGGRQVKRFEWAWRNACEKAGFPGSYSTISAVPPFVTWFGQASPNLSR